MFNAFLSRLRARDLQELGQYGYTNEQIERIIRAPHVESAYFQGPSDTIACAIWFDALTPKALAVSLLATDEWPDVAREVYRWAKTVARPKLVAMGYLRCECRTLAGHEDAIRMLEHLGFTMECRVPQFGATGHAFIQYAWRLNDHVHVNP